MQGTTIKNAPDAVPDLEELAPEELFREGYQHFKAREFSLARAFFERYIGLVPSDAQACHLLARVYYHENDNLDKAADCLERAVQLDPEGACGFYQTMAEVYIHLGEYKKAEEALVLAAGRDTGDDPKLTGSIDFYLNLVKKKNRAKLRDSRPDKELSGYYSAKWDERYNRKGRHLFLAPSLIVHLLVLLFLGYLSGMNLVPKKEAPMDFAYIDVGVVSGEETQGAKTAAPAPGERTGSAKASPAERGPVAVGAPGRRSAPAQIGGSPDFAGGGPRSLSAEKAAAGLEASASPGDAPAPGSARRRLDITDTRVRGMQEDVVNFNPGKLHFGTGGEAASVKQASAGVKSVSRAEASASVPGITGAEPVRAADRAEPSGRKAGASLAAASIAERVPAPSDAGDKSVVLDRPADTVSASLFADAGMARSAPGELGIKTSDGKSGSEAGRPSDKGFGTVKRSGAKAAAAAFDTDDGSRASGGPGLRGVRGATGLTSGKPSAQADAPMPTTGAERMSRIDTARAGRQMPGVEPLPASSDLGISVGKTSTVKAQRGGASSGGPKGISDRQASAPAGASGREASAFDADEGTRTSGPARPQDLRGAMSLPSGSSGAQADAPMLMSRAERVTNFGTARAGRQMSGSEPLPASRDLGISVGKTAAGRVQRGGSLPGGPKGISDRQASAAPAGARVSAGGGIETAAVGRGYSAAVSGKGVNAGALSGGKTPEGAPAGIKTAGKKLASISETPGRQEMESVPGSVPRRAGGLDGLVKETAPKKGGEPGGGGKGRGPGVRLGGGEKTGTAAPPGRVLSGLHEGGAMAGAASLEKKDSGAALGVPGGQGQERYAAVAKARTGSIAPEKKSGVSITGNASSGGLFGLSVKILSPSSGNTRELTHIVTGMVSDPKLTRATLTVNNDSRVVSVSGGRFESSVALSEGENVITVMAFDKDGRAGKDTVTVNYRHSQGSVPVKISEPRDGQVFDVSRMSIIKVRGTIGDPKIKRATMILNGRTKEITVKDGRFSQEVALTQENNTVVIEAEDGDGGYSTSPAVNFATMNVKSKDIMIILTWDKPNSDFDLHVYGPMGGHSCYKSPNIYESNEAIAGAQLEQDAKGNYGPEVFTMENTEKGIYTVKSNYFYSGGDGDAHATVTVILYGDNPARRIVRVFGPHLQVDTKTGEEMWDVTRFKMPEGIFLED